MRCRKQSSLPSCVNAFSSCYDRVMAYSGTLEKFKGTKSYQVKIENCNFDIKDENIGRYIFMWEWLFNFLGILIAITSFCSRLLIHGSTVAILVQLFIFIAVTIIKLKLSKHNSCETARLSFGRDVYVQIMVWKILRLLVKF